MQEGETEKNHRLGKEVSRNFGKKKKGEGRKKKKGEEAREGFFFIGSWNN